jgi:hypothetical protein
MNTNSATNSAGPRWIGVFNDRIIPLPRQKLPVSLMRVLASVPGDHAIVRDHQSPEDEVLDDGATIDLADGNVFRIVPRCDVGSPSPCNSPAKKALSVDDKFELIVVDQLPREAVLSLFGLDLSTVLCRDFESPNDPVIPAGATVCFVDGPTFLTRGNRPKHIDVVVATTAGFYPTEGVERLPIDQPVKVQLAKAAKALKITDVSGWIARVGTRELDVEKSYAANGLECKVEIDYGRREGGGGAQ